MKSASIHLNHLPFPQPLHPKYLFLLNLLLEDILERNRVSCEFRNSLSEFLNRHGLLIEVEAEERFVFKVSFLLNVECGCAFRVELLLNFIVGVVKIFEEIRL